VASLLEVVESFKDRYVAAGKVADAAYLISGLNILNDAEINYRSARNKRLHVELALIKLCYLGQALQLTSDETGKKKQVDTVRPVSFRNIPVMQLITKGTPATAGGAKLMVETKATGIPPAEQKDRPAKKDRPAEEDRPTDNIRLVEKEGTAGTLGSLSKIRKQFTDRQQTETVIDSKVLEPEALQKAWSEYASLLRDNKNPAVQSLELAVLRILDAHSFEVVTSNPLEQKFIEHEKRTLSDHLQKAFADKTLSFAVIVEERADMEEPGERPLNKREQFIQIVEQYPLVKELKDRLKLELDY
jgi:DNA polymerase III subunit gamma/tau